MKNFIKKLLVLMKKNIGVTIILGLVFIFLIFTLCYLLFANNISVIEENKIKSGTSDLVNYFDDLVDTKSNKIDKYILFSLDYSNGMYSKKELTVNEIYEFIKKHFTIKVTEEDIKNIGITELLVENNVTYDFNKESYKLNSVKTNNALIAETPIKYYKLESISKVNRKKYKATYRIYTITNPFDMLNYYMDKNNKTEGVLEGDSYVYDLKDLEPIKNYLSGSGSILDLKKCIDDDIAKYSKKGSTIKITYVIEDDNVLIDKIK